MAELFARANGDAVVHLQIQPGAKRCFEQGLRRQPNQSGTVVLLITLAPTGKVQSVSAGADGRMAVEVVDCIQWVAKRATFDSPGPTTSTIRVELTFPM
jgi:hypothetical protein